MLAQHLTSEDLDLSLISWCHTFSWTQYQCVKAVLGAKQLIDSYIQHKCKKTKQRFSNQMILSSFNSCLTTCFYAFDLCV